MCSGYFRLEVVYMIGGIDVDYSGVLVVRRLCCLRLVGVRGGVRGAW